MKNGLLRKIGVGIILPLAFALSSCTKNYIIDGNNVKDNPFIFNSIVENKGDTLEIKYSLYGGGNGLKKIKINRKKYNFEDRDVYLKALNHYWYLTDKIDSIKVENSPKTQKEIDYGIKAFE